MNNLDRFSSCELIAELHQRQAAAEAELAALLQWKAPDGVSQSCRDLGVSTVQSVADGFGLRSAVIMGRGRTPKVAKARAVAMAGMHQAGFSLAEIGRFFDRDHGSVLHALKTVKTHS